MNNKANADVAMNTIVYLVLLMLFLFGIWAFINNQKEGAGIWEDYYTKEIVKLINSAKVGEEVVLDVHRATEIAKGNGVEFGNIFSFSHENKEACVKIGLGMKSCFQYFNNVIIVEPRIEYGLEDKPINKLLFKIGEVKNG